MTYGIPNRGGTTRWTLLPLGRILAAVALVAVGPTASLAVPPVSLSLVRPAAILTLQQAEEDASEEGDQEPPVPAEIIQQDLDGDGVEDSVLLYTNSEGKVERAVADTDADGQPDLWARYGVAGPGSVELSADRDRDGVPDAWRVFIGNTLQRRGRDPNGDGLPDEWLILDRQGRVTGTWRDTDADGRLDVWTTHFPNGGIQQAAYDTDGDGEPDRWVNHRPDGSVESVQQDTDGDGEPEQH